MSVTSLSISTFTLNLPCNMQATQSSLRLLFDIFLTQNIKGIERSSFLFPPVTLCPTREGYKELIKRKEVKNICNCYYSFRFGIKYKMTKKR